MTTKHFNYGYHIIHNILLKQPHLIRQLFLQSDRDDERFKKIMSLAQSHQIAVQYMKRDKLTALVGEHIVHQGVVAECVNLPTYNESDLYDLIAQKESAVLLLILDGVQDPQNLGACLRTANALGVDAIVAPKDKAASLTATAQKISCGAAIFTPFIQVTNLARCMQELQKIGVWIVGMAADAKEQLREIDLMGNIALVLGNEGEGIRRLTREHCDYLAKIAMQGDVESMNVSATAAICLYEATRQRG